METVVPTRAGTRRQPPVSSDLTDILWKAADKLRGTMDAAEYKHFVLGLVFLKYVSDTFEEQTTTIGPDGQSSDREGPARPALFLVPPQARWDAIIAAAEAAATSATTAGTSQTADASAATVGLVLDDAMLALARANPDLLDVLPEGRYSGRGIDERRLAELVGLIHQLGFGDRQSLTSGHGDGTRRPARDVLGEVYEYCLERFALAEGRRGGEYFTPKCVVSLLVEVLRPRPGELVYDPACGSGGMFVQAERFIQSHGHRAITTPAGTTPAGTTPAGAGHQPGGTTVFGQELNQTTWRLSAMNCAIHGIRADLGGRWADSFHEDLHPDLRADVIMANPPFNISDWGGQRLAGDPRWRYGVPPPGNANFAWLQHMASKLAPDGRSGIVLANGSMSSRKGGEGDIRRAMVEDDLVACIVALPGQLFRSTPIPACLWFLARSKTPSAGHSSDRRGQVLFIDARDLGTLVNRTERRLTEADLQRVSRTYHRWRGTPPARPTTPARPTVAHRPEPPADHQYQDVPGFCHSAALEEIRDNGFILTPGRYVGIPAAKPPREPLEQRLSRLASELEQRFAETARLEAVVREQLRGLL